MSSESGVRKFQEISEIEEPFKCLLYQRCQLYRVLHDKSLLFAVTKMI